ncbi:AMP-binding protein, partial [Aquimarina celericrescens]|nr:AMP-binding protein [Aquimarina celericrescens]
QETDAFLLKSNYTFDVSVPELFGWFVGNGKLVILEEGDEKNPSKIVQTLSDNKVTHLNFSPSMFKLFVEHVSLEKISEKLKDLRYICLCGEVVTEEMA